MYPLKEKNFLRRTTNHLSELHVFGVSYQTANVEQRQAYSLSEVEQVSLLANLKKQTDFKGFIISTCNRTEVIGLTHTPDVVLALYLDHTSGSTEEFSDLGYHLTENDALTHLFRVGVGMESQIPGDFEIIMQLRKGFRWAYKAGMVNGYLEKIVNQVIYTSKRVKTETAYSTGATSVSYAAARYLKDTFDDLSDKSITLYGLGKFGRITLDHLLGLTAEQNITLVNRSDAKSKQYAEESGAMFAPHSDLQEALNAANILIVATGADRPILGVDELSVEGLHTIIDLAVPSNVDPAVRNLPNVTLLNVDELSQMTRAALENRQNQLPKVEEIVNDEIQELMDWHIMRGHAPQIETAIANLLDTDEQLTLANLVEHAYEVPTTEDSEEKYLKHKMQRYFCHHIRRGQSVDFIRTELSSRLSVISSK